MNIPPELTAAIQAGRAEIAEKEARAKQRAAEQEAEDERKRSKHLDKLPAWMREYTEVIGDHNATLRICLPGCSPIIVQSNVLMGGFSDIYVIEPMSIYFDDEGEQWYVGTCRHSSDSIEEAVAVAADYGEAYWTMQAEVDRREEAGILPESNKPVPVEPSPETAKPGVPDPLERIVLVLERIANRLEGGVIYTRYADTI